MLACLPAWSHGWAVEVLGILLQQPKQSPATAAVTRVHCQGTGQRSTQYACPKPLLQQAHPTVALCVPCCRKTAITTRILSLVHELCLKQIHVTKRDLFYTDVKLFEVCWLTRHGVCWPAGLFVACQSLHVLCRQLQTYVQCD